MAVVLDRGFITLVVWYWLVTYTPRVQITNAYLLEASSSASRFRFDSPFS